MKTLEEFSKLVEIFIKKDDDDVRKEIESYYKYYWIKYLIALHLQPYSINEIGVRAGYSAISFLTACPEATYHGYDAYVNRDGGKDLSFGYKEYAEGLLKTISDKTIIEIVDTQKCEFIFPDADLCHIDGDHTYNGAMNDLESCKRNCKIKIILVDDYDFISTVKQATDDFIKKYSLYYKIIHGLRGEAIIAEKEEDLLWVEELERRITCKP
jgi:hypothetical protein